MQTFTYEEIREKALKQGITITGLELAYGLAQMAILKAKERYKGKYIRFILRTTLIRFRYIINKINQ